MPNVGQRKLARIKKQEENLLKKNLWIMVQEEIEDPVDYWDEAAEAPDADAEAWLDDEVEADDEVEWEEEEEPDWLRDFDDSEYIPSIGDFVTAETGQQGTVLDIIYSKDDEPVCYKVWFTEYEEDENGTEEFNDKRWRIVREGFDYIQAHDIEDIHFGIGYRELEKLGYVWMGVDDDIDFSKDYYYNEKTGDVIYA